MNLLPPYDLLCKGLPADSPPAARKIALIDDENAAEAFAEHLETQKITAIALDSEYRFSTPGVSLHSGRTWHDIRSQQPICCSIAVAVAGFDDITTTVLDVRKHGVAAQLGRILRLRVPFVFHNAESEFFSLWALGLDPNIQWVYDTKIVALCLNLGRYHPRATGAPSGEPESNRIRREITIEEEYRYAVSLVGQCAHYNLGYPFSESKDDLRTGFLDFDMERPLRQREIDYAAADATWTLKLNRAQQAEIQEFGLHHHLETVEFPFIVANARIEWSGVYVDRDRCRALRVAARAASQEASLELASHGISDPNDRHQFLDVMGRADLRRHFEFNGIATTDDDVLKDIVDLHPAIAALSKFRKFSRVATDESFNGTLIGLDGRIHPAHHQLGAATGRNTCTTPSLAGISRAFRPVVRAPDGKALVELDYSQIEVGIAAAEHDDPELIAAYNDNDVYVAMAKRFFADTLTVEDHNLTVADFKNRHGDLRDRMKTVVLAVIYGMRAPALARKLRISVERAREERLRFLDMFPVLRDGMERSKSNGLARGYATTVSGLRRYVSLPIHDLAWTKNFLANTPIQGSAAVVFKRAVVLLDEAFRHTETRLVLPIHDAVLIECRTTEVEEVTQTARTLMAHALRAIYPKLRPRISVNAVDTTCWNKDGDSKSLDRFIAEHSTAEDIATTIPTTRRNER